MAEPKTIELTEDLEGILKYLDKSGLSLDDLKKINKQKGRSEPNLYSSIKLPFNAKRLKYGVVSDTHMGHKNYRPDILTHAAKYMKKQGCEFMLLPGDILEGMSGREGHIYELDKIGATAQLNYAVEQLSQIDMPIYAITATNSHDGWFSNKSNMGFEVGPELERRIKNFHFIGYDEADLVLDNGLKLRMLHPGGGTAYAISYKGQKYLNAVSGGEKPNVMHCGHYHKMIYMNYRNVHYFEAGTLESQTVFMKKMGTPAMLGYTLIDLVYNKKKKEVERIRPEFVTYY